MSEVSHATGRRRLLLLAEFLETKVPRRRFVFAEVVYTPYGKKGGYGKGCGTVGCAVGWMPAIPAFKRLGVTIETVDDGFLGEASRVFGISKEESCRLFMPGAAKPGDSGLGDTATPKQVAKHIRAWVAEHRPVKGRQ